MARPKKIKQRQEEIQQSSSLTLDEIKRLEAPFEKKMGHVDEAIEHQHGWIKKEIQEAAIELDKAGTVPTDHICSRIVERLQPKILAKMIHIDSIYHAFDEKGFEKYKQKQYVELAQRMRKWQDDVVVETNKVVQHWTGLSAEEVIRTPIDVAVSSTTAFRKHLIIGWNDEQIIFARQVLAATIPILENTRQLVEQEWQARRKKEKLLSR